MLKAIETRYKGYRFRSRLEARWAVFFDTLSIKYEYEPEGFDLGSIGLYLPDFFLPQFGMWAEIKGKAPTKDEILKAEYLGRNDTEHVVLIIHGQVGDELFMLFDTVTQKWLDDRFIGTYPVWCDLLGHTSVHSMQDTNYCDSVRHAYEAARAARFEHGETPKVTL